LRAHIVVNVSASARTAAQGAQAIAAANTLWLDPAAYDPGRYSGRYLLAHELIHIVQQSLGAQPAVERAAQREAERLARALASDRAAPAPQNALAPSALAPSKDVKAPESDPSDATLTVSRQTELTRIQDLLSYGVLDWGITEADVTEVLLILQDVAFVTAREIVRTLDQKYRLRLIDHFSDIHYQRLRRQILACYAGMGPEELKQFGERLLLALELDQLEDDEHFAVRYVFDSLPGGARDALLKSKHGPVIAAVDKTTLNWSEEEAIQGAKRDEAEAAKTADEISTVFKADPKLGEAETLLKKVDHLRRRPWSAHHALPLCRPAAEAQGAHPDSR
jgi:hypothetical protein